MTEKNWEKAKHSFLLLVSSISFIFIAWLLFFGKIKIAGLLSPLLGKVPRNESALVKITEDVLGEAVEKVKGENLQQAVQKGSSFFETSGYAEPARDIRDDVKKKIDETIESAKELPAKELKTVQLQVCKEWLGEEMIATGSGAR